MPATLQRTILVIDNDDDLRRALTKKLGSAGFRCVSAASGAQGLARFHHDEVDLVVSDLSMPCGDGVALAESIRRTSNVPIIFVTGFRDDFKRRMRHIQNVTTLCKPFDSNVLLDLISATLDQSLTPTSLASTTLEEP